MIPSNSISGAVPPSTGNVMFHVIIDDFDRAFSMDGPGGPNGVLLHYEMQQLARNKNRTLRDFDLWAESLDAALAQMKKYFPDHVYLGCWRDATK